jgi:hypothetical protein
MDNYQIIDADGHVRESIAGMRKLLEPRWQRRNLFPNDGIAICAVNSAPSRKDPTGRNI